MDLKRNWKNLASAEAIEELSKFCWSKEMDLMLANIVELKQSFAQM
jgi:hypothetical protein